MELSPRLQLTGLSCTRGGRVLFSGVSLSLGPGDAALVTGPNGVGKSSLLRLIAGLLEPAAGELDIVGEVALANDQAALDADMPLVQALEFWATLHGTKGAGNALEQLGIAHLAQVPVRILSTGQRKRAGLARAITKGAQIWLLDEPSNGLDSDALTLLESVIARHRSGGGIVMVASHQPIALPDAKMVAL